MSNTVPCPTCKHWDGYNELCPTCSGKGVATRRDITRRIAKITTDHKTEMAELSKALGHANLRYKLT